MTGPPPGAPPGKAESRPPEGDRPTQPDTTTTARPKPEVASSKARGSHSSARRACRHVTTRFCPSCVVERRRASDELNAMYPRPPRVPCTFSLDERELRAHARELRLAGWSNGELRQVLDLEPVSSP